MNNLVKFFLFFTQQIFAIIFMFLKNFCLMVQKLSSMSFVFVLEKHVIRTSYPVNTEFWWQVVKVVLERFMTEAWEFRMVVIGILLCGIELDGKLLVFWKKKNKEKQSSYPPQRSCRGVYWFHHVRPSVCRQIICRTITWVVFLRIFLNFISCLLVKRGGSLSFLTIFTFAIPELLDLIWRKIGFLPYVVDNLSSVSQNVLKFYQQHTGEERRIPFIFGRNNQ